MNACIHVSSDGQQFPLPVISSATSDRMVHSDGSTIKRPELQLPRRRLTHTGQNINRTRTFLPEAAPLTLTPALGATTPEARPTGAASPAGRRFLPTIIGPAVSGRSVKLRP